MIFQNHILCPVRLERYSTSTINSLYIYIYMIILEDSLTQLTVFLEDSSLKPSVTTIHRENGGTLGMGTLNNQPHIHLM